MNNIYAQMYSVRGNCEENFVQALREIAEIGYAGVEFAGYYGIKAKELKLLLDELGLDAISAHIQIDLLENELDRQIEILKILEAKFIVCPYTNTTTVEEAKDLAKVLNKIGKKTYEEGLTLLYHNHAHELELDNGNYPLEVLFENVNQKYIKQQPDVYWIKYAGLNPIDYVAKHADRIPAVHLKQMLDMESKKNVDAGSGIIDFKKIMNILPNAYCIYEQEYSEGNIIKDMKKSLESIK